MSKSQKIEQIKTLLQLEHLTLQELNAIISNVKKVQEPQFDLSRLTDSELRLLAELQEKAQINGIRVIHLGSGIKPPEQ